MHQENLIAMNSNFETLPIKFQSLLCRNTVVNWDFTTRQQAYLHSLRTDAKLKIHQVYKHKSSSTMQNRSSANSFRLRCQTHPDCSKRGTTERRIWNTFSIAKTYNGKISFETLPICFTSSAEFPLYSRGCVPQCLYNGVSLAETWRAFLLRLVCPLPLAGSFTHRPSA